MAEESKVLIEQAFQRDINLGHDYVINEWALISTKFSLPSLLTQFNTVDLFTLARIMQFEAGHSWCHQRSDCKKWCCCHSLSFSAVALSCLASLLYCRSSHLGPRVCESYPDSKQCWRIHAKPWAYKLVWCHKVAGRNVLPEPAYTYTAYSCSAQILHDLLPSRSTESTC